MARKRIAPKNKTRTKREFHPQAAKVLCSKGATIAELVDAFNVAISTIWTVDGQPSGLFRVL